MQVPTRVLLPAWVFKRARGKDDIRANALRYMRKAYPDYQVIKIQGHYAICLRDK